MSLDILLKHLRFSLRTLARSPSFTLAALLALALGIGANSAIFTVVDAVLLRPLPYEDPERLAAVTLQSPPMSVSNLPMTDAEYFFYRERAGFFTDLAAWSTGRVHLSEAGNPERLTSASTTANLMDVLGSEPLLGRYFGAEEDRPGAAPVVVLSHDLWQRRYGGREGILGTTVRLDGEHRTVVGILPPEVAYPTPEVDVWLPLGLDPLQLDPANRRLQGLARLHPGTSPEQAEQQSVQLTLGLSERYPELFPRATLEQIQLGMQVQKLRESMVGDVRSAMLVLLAAVGLVLLVACANVAGLLLARSEARKTELAVRSAVGAGRANLIGQVMVESLLLGLAGGLLGLLVGAACLEALEVLRPEQIPRLDEVGLDLRSVLLTFGLSLVTAVLFGLLPALRTSRPDLQTALREGGRSSGGRRQQRLRWAFVVVEVALACVLLIGAGLLLRSFHKLNQVDPGFQRSGVLTAQMELPTSRYPDRQAVRGFYQRLLGEVHSLPGVRTAALVNDLPLGGSDSETSFQIEGRPPVEGEAPRNADFQVVTPGYFELMDIPILQGRAFETADSATATGVVIVDQTLARLFWPDDDPVGQRLRVPGEGAQWRVVVGVADSVLHDSLQGEPSPTLYLPQAQMAYSPTLGGWRSMALLVRTGGEATSLIPPVRATVRRLDPELPLAEVQTLEQVAAGSFARTAFLSVLLAAFAVAALLLAAVGLYGVLSYLTVRRTHEFGLRMALGSTRQQVLKLVMRGALLMVGAGAVVGLLGALLLNRYLETLLFDIGGTDALTFVTVPVVLLLTGLLAALAPALRALRISPTQALRYE